MAWDIGADEFLGESGSASASLSESGSLSGSVSASASESASASVSESASESAFDATVADADFLKPVQRVLFKFEVYVPDASGSGGTWYDFTNLG